MRKLAAAGIIGPILFLVLVVVQSVLQPDYSQVSQPISVLSVWPLGWVQNLNFFLAGTFMIAHAVGLHLGVARRRGGWIGPLLLAICGVGIILGALFPWQREGVELVEPLGHVVGAFCAFLGAGLGLIAMSWRMAADRNWRGLVKYTRACGIAIIVLFIAVGFFALEEGTPLHPWAGLVQRLLLAVWFPCIMILSGKLLRTTQDHELVSNGLSAPRAAGTR